MMWLGSKTNALRAENRNLHFELASMQARCDAEHETVELLTEQISALKKQNNDLCLEVESRDGDSAIANANFERERVENTILSDQLNVILQNQDEYEELIQNMIAVLTDLYQYLTRITSGGFFYNNPEMRELSHTIKQHKDRMLELINEKFVVEDMKEIQEQDRQEQEQIALAVQNQKMAHIMTIGSVA